MKLIIESDVFPDNFTGIVECNNGNKYWYLNGKLHRENGPAIEHKNGNKYWYLNGELHREDGPAIECSNGTKYWYKNGVNYTESDFLKLTKSPSCNGKIVEIDGKKYKLTLV